MSSTVDQSADDSKNLLVSIPMDVMTSPEQTEEKAPENLSWGVFCSGVKTSISERSGADWGWSLLRIACLLFFLYCFLASLDLMGSSFKIIGGCEAGGMFNGVDNPIAGLMIGILATVMVQSSSTSTSIVVSLVGAKAVSVSNAIPIIMGANIGTSVTNTIVSLGQINDPNQFKRAFAGATVHDMFNFLCVIVFLPIEVILHPLELLTAAITPDSVSTGEKWVGPIKIIVSPLVSAIIKPDKSVIQNVAAGTHTCESIYASGSGLVKGGIFHIDGATQNEDISAGIVCLIFSLLFLCLCLGGLVKILSSMMSGVSEPMMRKATNLNGYLAMLVGAGVTLLVQSSSITTSVLTPLVGLGVIQLENMYPLTLGANVGTTCTALLASMVSTEAAAVQIALCHLFFNIFGIILWYPIPQLRRIPIALARTMGEVTLHFRLFPIVYILISFVIVPMTLLGLSSLLLMSRAYQVIGWFLTTFVVLGLAWGIFWYKRRNGKQAFLNTINKWRERAGFVSSLPVTVDKMSKQIAALENKLNSLQGVGDPMLCKQIAALEDKVSSLENSKNGSPHGTPANDTPEAAIAALEDKVSSLENSKNSKNGSPQGTSVNDTPEAAITEVTIV